MHKLDTLLNSLYQLNRLGIKPGLEAEQALLKELGNPEKHLPCIHIAGSNGKGSVSILLDSALRAAGLKTGLYTSPHLVRFNERIRYNGICISDSELAELLPEIMAAGRRLADAPGGRQATFFEITTALAFAYFNKMHPDIVILETGMGGRLDATNVITPLAAVITGISLEHTEYLGETLAAIAREKAGIIKPGRPVITGALPPEALEVIRAVALERQAPLIEVLAVTHVTRRSQDLAGQKIRVETGNGMQFSAHLPLLGKHQLHNAALAACVLENVFQGAIPEKAIKKGWENISWPARLQVLQHCPPIILDAAHNPEGAVACSRALKELLPPRTPVGLIIAMCADKDMHGYLNAFDIPVRQCWTPPMRNPRGQAPTEIAAAAAQRGWPVEMADSVPQALEAARAWAGKNKGAVCIAGSLFLAGEVLEHLKIYPRKSAKNSKKRVFAESLTAEPFKEREG